MINVTIPYDEASFFNCGAVFWRMVWKRDMSFLVLVLSQYLRFLHASCLALQAYSLRFLLTLSVLDISKAPGFQ